jgi:hypothetical protein
VEKEKIPACGALRCYLCPVGDHPDSMEKEKIRAFGALRCYLCPVGDHPDSMEKERSGANQEV